LLLFYVKSGYANAPQCCVKCALPLLLIISIEITRNNFILIKPVLRSLCSAKEIHSTELVRVEVSSFCVIFAVLFYEGTLIGSFSSLGHVVRIFEKPWIRLFCSRNFQMYFYDMLSFKHNYKKKKKKKKKIQFSKTCIILHFIKHAP